MKQLLSNNYNLTVSNLIAVSLTGDGSNLTNVGGELPYYMWTGILNISSLTLTTIYSDSYFNGDLSVQDLTQSGLGYTIISAGSKFVDSINKTVIRAPLYVTDPNDQNQGALSVTSVTSSYISLSITGNPSISVTGFYGDGVTVLDIPIEIRQYK
jgi:hypothetical protein